MIASVFTTWRARADKPRSGLSSALYKLAIWNERAIYCGTPGPLQPKLHDGQLNGRIYNERSRHDSSATATATTAPPSTATASAAATANDATYAAGAAEPRRHGDSDQPTTSVFRSSSHAKPSTAEPVWNTTTCPRHAAAPDADSCAAISKQCNNSSNPDFPSYRTRAQCEWQLDASQPWHAGQGLGKASTLVRHQYRTAVRGHAFEAQPGGDQKTSCGSSQRQHSRPAEGKKRRRGGISARLCTVSPNPAQICCQFFSSSFAKAPAEYIGGFRQICPIWQVLLRPNLKERHACQRPCIFHRLP